MTSSATAAAKSCIDGAINTRARNDAKTLVWTSGKTIARNHLHYDVPASFGEGSTFLRPSE
jgi:hypothetical protein